MKAPDGGVMGVHSVSNDKPLKTARFLIRDRGFEGAASYSDWKFVYVPASAQKPGQQQPQQPGAQSPRCGAVPIGRCDSGLTTPSFCIFYISPSKSTVFSALEAHFRPRKRPSEGTARPSG
jgi:hypothetical protein